MATKGWVKTVILQMGYLFGQAKVGLKLNTEREIHDYVCKDFGGGILLSQNGELVLMYIRKVRKVKRDACWNKPARVAELGSILYSNTLSKLYYGFLKEHSNSFIRIILAKFLVNQDNSVFLPALNDTEKHPLDNDIITHDLLLVYSCMHQSDMPGSPMPETGKYPLMNDTMLVTPPTLRKWTTT